MVSRRKKEEGRRKKEEGRRKKEEESYSKLFSCILGLIRCIPFFDQLKYNVNFRS